MVGIEVRAGTWVQRFLVFLLSAAATAGATLAGCSTGSVGADGSLATLGEATTYDTAVVKPIPTVFLNLKTAGNQCCVGQNKKLNDASCKPCATANGLITTEGYNKADDYYRATGQADLDTLQKWKDAFHFPKRLLNESVENFRSYNDVVVYYNRTELGLGRELGCVEDGGNIACYVTNYGDTFNSVHNLWDPDAYNPDGSSNGLWDAIDGIHPKNTVVISSVPARNGTQEKGLSVQFAAYDANGRRLNKAQLDTMGARPIPQICMSCHGGVWDADATTPLGNSYFGAARFARFLPLVTQTVSFSNYSPYTLADQEEAIRQVNEYAYRTPEGLTSRQQSLLKRVYLVDTANKRLSFDTSSLYAQRTDYAPPLWTPFTQTYNTVALPYCDTCHMAMDPSSSWPITAKAGRPAQKGDMYSWLDDLAAFRAKKAMVAARMGLDDLGFLRDGTVAKRAELQMPHAQNAFARFWGDTVSIGGSCDSSGVARPASAGAPTSPAVSMAVCLLGPQGAQLWSGTPAASYLNNTYPFPELVPASAAYGECGKASNLGDGTNSGRKLRSVSLPGSGTQKYESQCVDGCVANQVYCPGSETVGFSPPFPSVRMECRPSYSGSSEGNCVHCGRLGQPACQQVGTGCRADMNPSCATLPACHEGYKNANGNCMHSELTGGTATQSSTSSGQVASRARDANLDPDPAHAHTSATSSESGASWMLDYGSSKHIFYIEIFQTTDALGLDNFDVQYHDGITWRTFEGGSFGSSWGDTYVRPPVPVTTTRIRIIRRDTGALKLAEVRVWGW